MATAAQLTTLITRVTSLESAVNGQWVLLTAAVAFVQQAGFCMFEAGGVRAKNVTSILCKNFFLCLLTAVIYWSIGYAFAFGGGNGFIGNIYFYLTNSYSDFASFFLQWVYSAACASIFSGGVAERMSLFPFILVSSLSAAWIYPVVVHWVWCSTGWLSMYGAPSVGNGLLDFGGGAVIHIVGGTMAFVGAWLIEPRTGRYDLENNEVEMRGHSTLLSSLGVFLMWFGWYGLNYAGTALGGAGSGVVPSVAARISINTTISAASCCLTALFVGYLFDGFPDAQLCLTSILAGLSASSSGAAVMDYWAALITGVVAAFVLLGSCKLLRKLKVDDSMSSSPIHLFCGAWGLISAGLFCRESYIESAYNISNVTVWGLLMGGGGTQFGVQLLGLVVIVAWTAGWTTILLLTLKAVGHLRISAEDEAVGVDAEFFGTTKAYASDMVEVWGKGTPKVEEEAEEDVQVLDVAMNNAMATLSKVRALVAESEDQSMVKRLDDMIKIIKSGALYESNIEEIAAQEGDADVKQWLRLNYMQQSPRNKMAEVKPSSPKASSPALPVVSKLLPATGVDLAYQQQEEQRLLRKQQNSARKNKSSEQIERKKNLKAYMDQHLGEWDYDVFTVGSLSNGRPLFYTARAIFELYNFPAKYKISTDVLCNFLRSIEDGYIANNPFHNALHAADVAHTLFFLIGADTLREHFSELETFAALVAAIVHDFRHPGVNNVFLINTGDDRSITYNDQSVLEHYHLAETFRLLKDPKINIFANLSPQELKEVRGVMIQMVLATDMSGHFKFVNEFSSKILNDFSWTNAEHRMNALMLLLKCADISNPSKPHPLNLKWCDLVLDEFFRQGDMELERGLPVSPLMSRNSGPKEKSQLAFIDFVLSPLMDLWAKFSGEKDMLHGLQKNRKYWQSIADGSHGGEEAADATKTTARRRMVIATNSRGPSMVAATVSGSISPGGRGQQTKIAKSSSRKNLGSNGTGTVSLPLPQLGARVGGTGAPAISIGTDSNSNSTTKLPNVPRVQSGAGSRVQPSDPDPNEPNTSSNSLM